LGTLAPKCLNRRHAPGKIPEPGMVQFF